MNSPTPENSTISSKDASVFLRLKPRREAFKRMFSAPVRSGWNPECRGKVESSGFRRLTDVIIFYRFPAIPSTNIVLHRGNPSRLPFGAQPRRGPDGTRPRCEETRSGMREWQALLWLTVLKAELSTLPDRNFLLCPDTANCFTGHSPQKVI